MRDSGGDFHIKNGIRLCGGLKLEEWVESELDGILLRNINYIFSTFFKKKFHIIKN